MRAEERRWRTDAGALPHFGHRAADAAPPVMRGTLKPPFGDLTPTTLSSSNPHSFPLVTGIEHQFLLAKTYQQHYATLTGVPTVWRCHQHGRHELGCR